MKFKLGKLTIERKLDIFFKALNLYQPAHKQLAKKEITLLSLIALLPDKFKYAPFSLPAKKYIRARALELFNWNITAINYNNKLYSLVKKNILVKDEDGVFYFSPTVGQVIENIKQSHLKETVYDITFSFGGSKDTRKQVEVTSKVADS